MGYHRTDVSVEFWQFPGVSASGDAAVKRGTRLCSSSSMYLF
jgi:hypothetical protein